MGYDANITFDSKIKKQKVEKILLLLKYRKIKNDVYSYYNEQDYKSLCGNIATFYYNANKLNLHLRTQIFCSNYDLYYMNYTIKFIKELFESTFYTDDGKNRYFKHDKIITKCEAGCYKAFFDIENDFANISLYVNIVKDTEFAKNNLKTVIPKEYNPLYVMTTMALPYLCTIIEDFFRNTFIAMFKYSENKEKVIKNVKINNNDLNKVSEGKMSIEEVIARSMSFQNIDKIINNFNILNSKIDIRGCLNKPYKNRKENLYESINRILEQRHMFIHSKIVEYEYSIESLKKDIELVEIALKRVYKYIVEFNNWEDMSI